MAVGFVPPVQPERPRHTLGEEQPSLRLEEVGGATPPSARAGIKETVSRWSRLSFHRPALWCCCSVKGATLAPSQRRAEGSATLAPLFRSTTADKPAVKDGNTHVCTGGSRH